MTGQELKNLRGDRTREKFAEDLGGCSASTINKWERGINPIPQWVVDKLFQNVELRLPLSDLAALLHHATEQGKSFEHMLTQSVRDYLAKHRAKIVTMALAEETVDYTTQSTTPHAKKKAVGE